MHAESLTLLIVEDHFIYRQGLKQCIEQGLSRPVTVFEAANLREAKACALANSGINIVSIDIDLPGVNGLHGISILRELIPLSRFIVISGTKSLRDMRFIAEYGAHSFVSKDANCTEICEAFENLLTHGVRPPVFKPEQQREGSLLLTPRQLEILELLAHGTKNKEIAGELDISENTVRVHVAAIIKALACSTRGEAVAVARKKKLID